MINFSLVEFYTIRFYENIYLFDAILEIRK